MNTAITRLAVVGVLLIVALIVATTYWQTWAAPALADRQDNAIQRVAEFSIDRGRILARNERTVLAANDPQRRGGKTLYFRRYPTRGLFAHVVGYSTQVRSRAGLERSQNDYLTASNANLDTVVDRTLDELRGSTIQGNDVVLTVDPRGQRAAQDALGSRCGAVVALEPRTGRVLVMYSSPTYDPNLMEKPGGFARIRRITGGCGAGSALLNRATDGLYAPGSTFKVVTAAAALESGKWDLRSTFVDPGYCEEYGKRVNNYDTTRPFGRVDFVQAMQYSINSVFCNLGKELGPVRLAEAAERFGFYSKPPLDTPVNERSPSGLYDKGELFKPEDDGDADPGRFAFGQERLLVTPLQMAQVAAAVANDGVVMEPQIVERVAGPEGRTVASLRPRVQRRAMSAGTARDVTVMMQAVVRAGTATRAQVAGVDVAGKTGTAETGISGVNTVSFVGFAPAETPRVALAVFVERQSGTGGSTAAPIAKAVLEALLHGRRGT